MAKLITDEQMARTMTSSPDIYTKPYRTLASSCMASLFAKRVWENMTAHLIKTLHGIRRRNASSGDLLCNHTA